jgi:hypothetical protein
MPRAKSQEPRAKSQEPRAKSQEPRDYLTTSDFVNPLIVYSSKIIIFLCLSFFARKAGCIYERKTRPVVLGGFNTSGGFYRIAGSGDGY